MSFHSHFSGKIVQGDIKHSMLIFLLQNQPFATSSPLQTKTAINNFFVTIFRIEIFCTESEIN